jgi:hypothetical protein
MTAPHSNPNPTLRRQIRTWFLTTLSALLLSASEAGLLAQFPAVTPGENGATPATRAGEIELARSQRAPHLEPEVKNRAEHDLQKIQDFGMAARSFGGAPGSWPSTWRHDRRLVPHSVPRIRHASCSTIPTPLATRISAAIILRSFQPSTMPGAVPVFYRIACWI